MLMNEVTAYIRENQMMVMAAVVGIMILFLCIILFQVARTHRKVHKICKKIRKYFDVILTEEPASVSQAVCENPAENQELKYAESIQSQKESLQKQKDAKLLMDVISDVF